MVALRKESVDRNVGVVLVADRGVKSLSARRAWIEIFLSMGLDGRFKVALRKESVDRNVMFRLVRSLLAVALRKESVDRNDVRDAAATRPSSRSPQGERG